MTTFSVPAPAHSKVRTITSWALQLLLAAAFAAAAVAKLMAVPMLVEIFQTIGLGQWFRIVTAIVELVGAVALLTSFAAFGALWLATTMFFGTIAHLTLLHTSPAAAVVLMVLSLVVAWLRRDQLAVLRNL